MRDFFSIILKALMLLQRSLSNGMSENDNAYHINLLLEFRKSKVLRIKGKFF